MYVLVLYRELFAAAITILVALGKEWIWTGRNARPILTIAVLGQILLVGFFGAFLSPLLLALSLSLTTSAYSSALSNLVPGITFAMAILFRSENLALGTRPGKAKVIGLLVSTFGAMLIAFYDGPKITSWHMTHILKPKLPVTHKNLIVGIFLGFISDILDTLVFLLMEKIVHGYNFPHFFTTTALVNSIGLVLCAISSPCFIRSTDSSMWRMGLDRRLCATTYTGILISGFVGAALFWCSGKKGSFYPAIFRPLTLVVEGWVGFLILDDSLKLESIIGNICIVAGICFSLWSKRREETALRAGEEVARRATYLLYEPYYSNFLRAIGFRTLFHSRRSNSSPTNSPPSTAPSCGSHPHQELQIEGAQPASLPSTILHRPRVFDFPSATSISSNLVLFESIKMDAKPLTREQIATTEKKLDMPLDDIIKSKNTTTKNKKQHRVVNKSQTVFNHGAQNKALKMQRYMDSRSFVRQGALAQRRSNFQRNQFPITTEAARIYQVFRMQSDEHALSIVAAKAWESAGIVHTAATHKSRKRRRSKV